MALFFLSFTNYLNEVSMKLKLKEKDLALDYIEALKEVEKVLWSGKMNTPAQIDENYKGRLSFFNPISYFLGTIALFTTTGAYGYSASTIFLIIATYFGFIVAYTYYKYAAKKPKVENTQYIITNDRIIFMIYKDRKIMIKSIPFSNIESAKFDPFTNMKSPYVNQDHTTILLTTKEEVDFKTYKYWTNEAHGQLAMVQLEKSELVLELINKQIRKSKA
jgi:hypothetical protein